MNAGIPGLSEVNGYAFEFLQRNGETFRIYKDGCNDGVAAVVCEYPRHGAFLAILSNQDCNVWAMQREIQRELVRQFG